MTGPALLACRARCGFRVRSGLSSRAMGDTAIELPVLPREPACPAAATISGVCGSQQGVVCRAMQRDIERDDGTALDMTAGQYGFLQHEADAGVYLNLKTDPASLIGFCHGHALPVLTDDDDKALARASYTRCPVWQSEKRRIAEGRERLVEEREPEPVAMGVSSADAPDPWAAARRGLDELAPEKRAA